MKTLSQHLHSKFKSARAANPRFSLRSLALKASLSPGHVSEIFSGKRPISKINLEKLAVALRLTPAEVQEAEKYFESDKARKKSTQSMDKVLNSTEFSEISSTEYFHTLAALDISFDSIDANNVAAKTGLSVAQTETILAKFMKLGILHSHENGHVQKSLLSISTESDIPNFDIQRFHTESLEKTKETFAKVPVDRREMVSVSMAINPQNIPLAKKEIEKCWKKVYTKLTQGERTEVYTLGIQLVPITADKVENT